jgi:hypothetical protein
MADSPMSSASFDTGTPFVHDAVGDDVEPIP